MLAGDLIGLPARTTRTAYRCVTSCLVIGLLSLFVPCRGIAAAGGGSSPAGTTNAAGQGSPTRCTTDNNSPGQPLHLYIPDGQLRSSPVRLYINCDLGPGADPVLHLYSGHALTKYNALEADSQQIDFFASGQSWTEELDGQSVAKSGTIVVANLSKYPIEWYKPMKRVMAVLEWRNGDAHLTAVGERAVNLGNATAAWGWAVLVVLTVLGAIALFAKIRSGSVVGLLCADDGHLSLSLTQIALWTIAIGTVSFFYGLIRFEVPAIPNSILVLMGLSLGTGAAGSAAPPQKSNAPPSAISSRYATRPTGPRWVSGTAVSAMVRGARERPRLSDLIYLFPREADALPQISLARAQMLFWTVIIIVIFVAKSAIDGVLWDVPTGFIILMGFSQAGYVGPKYIGPYAGGVTAGVVS
jgi:hypothetical protein